MTSLSLQQAEDIVDAGLDRARELGLKPLTIAVLDAGGHLVAFKRQDRSGILRPDIAQGKAWGALGMGLGGRALAQRAETAPAFFTALASVSHGRVVPVPGARTNASIGTRDLIQVGAESINIVSMSSDPLIVPSTTVSTLVFSIGHGASGTVENFITFDAFITTLTSELNGSVLVTGVTALGQYTSSSYTFSATSITVVLNN